MGFPGPHINESSFEMRLKEKTKHCMHSRIRKENVLHIAASDNNFLQPRNKRNDILIENARNGRKPTNVRIYNGRMNCLKMLYLNNA